MYIVAKGVIINPLQVESLRRIARSPLLNKEGKEEKSLEITMASGAIHNLDNDNCSDVELAMQNLMQQIDVANGMEILHVKKKKDGGLG